jgi:hypothetical protein
MNDDTRRPLSKFQLVVSFSVKLVALACNLSITSGREHLGPHALPVHSRIMILLNLTREQNVAFVLKQILRAHHL